MQSVQYEPIVKISAAWPLSNKVVAACFIVMEYNNFAFPVAQFDQMSHTPMRRDSVKKWALQIKYVIIIIKP